jgi:hypothetical protein
VGDEAVEIAEIAVRVLEVGGAVTPGEGGGGPSPLKKRGDKKGQNF